MRKISQRNISQAFLSLVTLPATIPIRLPEKPTARFHFRKRAIGFSFFCLLFRITNADVQDRRIENHER